MHLRDDPSFERYDDLIIGAGSSGAVMAARLSEDPSRRVLLLEAGPDFPNLASLPHALRNPNEPVLTGYNWPIRAIMKEDRPAVERAPLRSESSPLYRGASAQGGTTVLETKPSIASGATFDYAVGKLVGGSSAVNGAMALRGLAEDYDEWAAECGPEWSWSAVLPRFREMEADAEGGDAVHGRCGLVPIQRDSKASLARVQTSFIEACRAHGLPETPDHNDPASTGVGIAPRNVAHQVRMSTARTHLDGARGRSNLTIIAGATVHHLTWKNQQTCDGAHVEVAGKISVFTAKRIILCAGTLNTPGILLRSGIGAPEALRALGVASRVALSGVGENLIDHPVVIMWAVPKTGASQLGGPTHQALLRHTSGCGARRNDLHLYMLGSVDTELFPLLKPALRSPVAIGLSVGLMNPKSRGTVRLVSTDPTTRPRVVSNCLTNTDDIAPLKKGMQLAWQLMQQPALRRETERIHVWTEGMIRSEAAMKQAITMAARPSWHAVGTAKMGRSSDARAVVDPRGRVYGTENLFVADASIMPTIPSAPTNLTSMMIAEKIAADLSRTT